MSIQSEIDRIRGNVAGAYSAVEEMGGVIPQQQTSANLAAAVRSIPSASGTPLDPAEVYRATRPADWLPMPEPQDNEMYFLFHIPDGASALLAFTVTCTGPYTVALGTAANGQFVQQSTVSAASGSKYEAELLADDWGGLTSDGFKQVMVKVSGTDILTWEPSAHSKKTAPANFSNWNIVEIACKLPKGTKVACGIYRETSALQHLKYFAWYGQNALTSANYMFQYCYSLIAVLQLDISKLTSMYYFFSYCTSLIALPQLNTSNVTDMYSTFSHCHSLTKVPLFDTSKTTRMYNTFNSCYSLITIPPFLTGQITSMYGMFENCRSLIAVPRLDIGQTAELTRTFNGCYSLGAVTFLPSESGCTGADISLADCSLGHQALVDLINSLPTVTAARTLTITGNPGAAELTGAEQAAAAGKNWTVTL